MTIWNRRQWHNCLHLRQFTPRSNLVYATELRLPCIRGDSQWYDTFTYAVLEVMACRLLTMIWSPAVHMVPQALLVSVVPCTTLYEFAVFIFFFTKKKASQIARFLHLQKCGSIPRTHYNNEDVFILQLRNERISLTMNIFFKFLDLPQASASLKFQVLPQHPSHLLHPPG